MQDKLFNELLESIQQADAIIKGELAPSRVFVMEANAVRLVRESVGLSQDRFAALIHVAPSTLRNWEQGRRKPGGAAAALLTAIRNDPANVIAALNKENPSGSSLAAASRTTRNLVVRARENTYLAEDDSLAIAVDETHLARQK
ncbi:MAG: helix-turn-helix domain-containing protein [Xanthomonadales bacterium]|nr:helix-turn-helix domain-containing protein [Xanthomonadales bacterium]